MWSTSVAGWEHADPATVHWHPGRRSNCWA